MMSKTNNKSKNYKKDLQNNGNYIKNKESNKNINMNVKDSNPRINEFSLKNQNISNDNKNKSKNSNNSSSKMKVFANKSLEKIKKGLASYNNFVIRNEQKIYSYYFYSSILIFIIMFFVSLFINSNLGYSINGIELEWNYSLVIAGAVFGFICFFIYLPIFILSITQFIEMIKKKKFDFMFYWMVVVQVFNLYFFLTIIIYSILNYRLFFIHEILYIFMLVAFWALHNKNKLHFNNFKKFNKNNESNKNKEKQTVSNK